MRLKSHRPQHSIRPAFRKELPPPGELTPAANQLASSSYATIYQTPVIAGEKTKSSSAGRWAAVLIVTSSLIWAASFVIGFQTALGIQVALALILTIAGLASPSLGLLAIGMLCALEALASEMLLTGGLLRFNTVNYVLLLIMVLYIPFILRLHDLNSRALQLFIILLALQLTFSSNKSSGVQDVLNIATTFGIVVYFARSLQDENTLYWLGVVNGVLAGLGGMALLMQINSLPYTNPNNWTYFQLTALFSICISFPYARILNKSKVLLLVLAAINLTWVFLSGSRGSLLIALFCVVYLFLSTRSITWSSVMLAMFILVGLWASTVFVEQQSYTVSRIQLLFDPSRSDRERTSQRSALAEAGVQIFMRNPFGIGTGSYRVEAASTNLVGNNRPAHSAWIKTLAENGVIGILLLIIFIGSFAVIGFRKHHEGKLLFGLFIALVLASAFVAKEFRGKSLWFLVAAGIVLLHPEQMLTYMKQRLKEYDVDTRRRLREVRFGRKR